MKWSSPKIYLPVAIVVAAVIIFLILLLAKPEGDPLNPESPAWPAQIITVKKTTLSPQLTLYGTVQSPKYTKLEASITAYVEKTPVLTGSLVKKEQLLIRLDPRDALIIFKQRTAEVNDCIAQLDAEMQRYQSDLAALKHEKKIYKLSLQKLKRLTSLELKKYTSQTELDQAESSLKKQALEITKRQLALKNHEHRKAQKQAKLNRAQALLDKARLDLERTEIKAPFDGQVTKLNVAVGDRVQPGEILIELYDKHAIEVKAQIPERWLIQAQKALTEKRKVKAIAIYHQHEVPLVLARLSGSIAKGKGAMEAIFVLAHKTSFLPIGASVTLRINLPKITGVFAVPPAAVYDNSRSYKVINHRLEAINIKIVGHRYLPDNQQQVIIKSQQLKNGDKILANHLPNAITGLKVKAINEK